MKKVKKKKKKKRWRGKRRRTALEVRLGEVLTLRLAKAAGEYIFVKYKKVEIGEMGGETIG